MVYDLEESIVKVENFGVYTAGYLILDGEEKSAVVILQDYRQGWFEMNVDTGILRKLKLTPTTTVLSKQLLSEEQVKASGIECVRLNAHRKEFYEYKLMLPQPSVVGLQVILTLTSHQVSGDRIVQALKVLDSGIPKWKITMVYVGGWKFELDGERRSAFDFLASLV